MNFRRLKYLLSIFLVGMLVPACTQQDQKINAGYVEEGLTVPFAVNHPDTTFIMPKKLEEISGLSYVGSDSSIIAINDEEGTIYWIEKETGQVIDEIDFGDDNDYEGVEKVGSIIYVLESDGDIHRYDLEKGELLDKFENKLSEENDLEGLGYHPVHNSLLLICKKRGLEQKKKAIGRIIYAVEPEKMDQVSKFHEIDISENFEKLASQGLRKGPFFNLLVMRRLRDFSPSGIAVRPSTKEIYIISSKGGVLVVLDPDDYHVTAILFLNRMTHIQPEGICFDDNDNLYISNEARGKPARLHVFEPTENIKVVDDEHKNVLEILLDGDSAKVDSIDRLKK